MEDAAQPTLLARAQQHGPRRAVADSSGNYTFDMLLRDSSRVAAALLDDREDRREQRVAFLITPGYSWVAVLFGIWLSGAVAVPLPMGAPTAELEYVINDTQAAAIIFDDVSEQVLRPLSSKCKSAAYSCGEMLAHALAPALPAITAERRAMILYTSGTTSRPKGVVTKHANIIAQITALVDAWEWSADDRILLCLPLHHVHGIINVVSCAMWAGATCEMLPRFSAAAVWDRIASGKLTLFMAVPTIYVRLIDHWEASSPERRKSLSDGAAQLRLMVSGSAALPITTLYRWKEITGHTLLERYGMTEIGMALSNPYRGERKPGTVGNPLPGVEVRLVDDGGLEVDEGTPGEIEVRGANVFAEYWGKPEATRDAFRNGWFRTGDTAVLEHGYYRILGRTSIDILKTGGHKVSALEVEEVLRDHPAIAECAVVGVPDPEWGERVAAALVLRDGAELGLQELRAWGKERLAAHKVPSRLLILESLPRNAMGKVTKPAIVALLSRE